MIFDQYSRYKACSDLLRQAGFAAGNSILDIGSGPECLFGQFLPEATMNYVDPLIPVGSGQGRITGNIFAKELEGQTFDCVTAVDVLEHISPEYRHGFLERMLSLGKNTIILGFPTSDSTNALGTDKAIDDQYRAIYGHDYPWLEEHYLYGLPSLAGTVKELEQLGWHCQTIGHGHAPWLTELLSFVICVWDIPGMRPLVQEISEEFNRKLYPHDFRAPFYRQFVVASREPLPALVVPASSVDDKAADQTFRTLMEGARQQYFSASLIEMAAQNARNAKNQLKLHELSKWGGGLSAVVAEKDERISVLSLKTQELSDWGIGLQTAVAEKDERISVLSLKTQELSDWGIGLQTAVAERDERISVLNRKTQELSDWGIGLQTAVAEKDERISVLSLKTQELSDWGIGLQTAVAERDERISVLNRKTQELSDWGARLQVVIAARDGEKAEFEQVLSSKQAELMKMSDWAYGMMQELERRNVSIVARSKSLVKRSVLFARRQLARTLLGNVVRHLRGHRRCREKRLSIDALRQSLKDNHGRLVIVFPVITWDFRWQRPQHIVSRLRDHGYSVLYLAMSLTAQGRRFRSDKDAIAEASFNELDRHINQIWVSTSNQVNIYTDPLEEDDLHNIFTGLSALVSELNPKSIKYLIQFPGWWPAVKQVKEKLGGRVIFDCMDDHGGFSTNTKQALITEESLVQSADLVITSSDLLEQRAKLANPNTIQVKNGTEFEHFANPRRNGELDHFCDRPMIGYYGAISDWFDMEIVAHCAGKHPDWNFVLIGATFGADLKPVDGLKNVHFLGEKPYKALPGYLAYFDVCTIPFKLIPLTLATNPVKFYEYLSAGKPVVAIELPELVAYREDCYLARDANEFLALLERAYAERDDEKMIERRIKLASENSWDSRVRDILESSKF
jgi:glycosyltransferase involved in cell wall biosynthesis